MIRRIVFTLLIVASILIMALSSYSLISYLLLFLGFSGLVYDLVLLRLRLDTEIKEIKKAIDSIAENAEPEVLVRNNNIKALNDLKMEIYGIARILTDDICFLRDDVLNKIDVPIYREANGRIFKNKAMKKLCSDVKKEPLNLQNYLSLNNVNYKKVEVEAKFFYFLPTSEVHGVHEVPLTAKANGLPTD